MLVLLVLSALLAGTAAVLRVRLAGRRGPVDRAGRRRRARTLALVAGPPALLAAALWAMAATGVVAPPARPDPPPDTPWCQEATVAASRTTRLFSAVTAGDCTDIDHSSQRWLQIDLAALRDAASAPEEVEAADRFGDVAEGFAARIDDPDLELEEIAAAMADPFFELLDAERALSATLADCPAPAR